MNFETQLRLWYSQNKRTLPWRESKDPYLVWLSEVIMQQTRVAQGTMYYLRFAQNYPTVLHLANAPADVVMKLWEGLGYYSRARNMHEAAKQIVADFGGKMPDNYQDLVKLKGVGPYTAAAISSICFNQKYAVVDGNVYRVLARIFGIETPINSSAGSKIFNDLANSFIQKSPDPGEYNQAIMEFGALHCTPKSPKCNSCIFSQTCVAFATGRVADLPVKIKSKPLKNRYLNYLLFVDGGKILIEKRTEKDIWEGLYQFPLYETASEVRVMHDAKLLAPSVKHLLSHQRLFVSFWELNPHQNQPKDGQILVDIEELKHYAFPIVLKRFIVSNLLHLQPRLP